MFQRRSGEKEIMDDLEGTSEIIQTLRELDIINKKLGGNKVTLNGLAQVLNGCPPSQKIRIADIGCGGGDIMIAMAQWAKKKHYFLEIYGIDANPHIIEFAKSNTQAYPEIKYETLNIFSKNFQKLKFDVVTCSLFTHHFTDRELISLFGQIKNQCKYLIVNDLHRHPLAFYSIKLLTKLFSKSQMVKNDAPISVLRGFIKSELEQILKASGITKYEIRWMWAFRWQLIASF